MSKHTTLETTMPGPSSAIIDHLLGELWERGGSDLLLTTGSAPFLRVDGTLRPLEGAALTEPEVDRLVTGVLGEELTERFRREKQVDFAFSWEEKARLRGNAFVQRGASALALRIIPFDVPSSDQLGLPPVAVGWAGMPRGFVLVTGPTGSGKSTSLAALPTTSTRTGRCTSSPSRTRSSTCTTTSVRRSTSARSAPTPTPSPPRCARHRRDRAPGVRHPAHQRHVADAGPHRRRVPGRATAADPAAVGAHPGRHPQPDAHPPDRRGPGAAFEVLVGTSAIRNLIHEGKTRQLRNMITTGHSDGMQTLEASVNALVAAGIAYEDAVLHTAYPEDTKRPQVPVGRA
ncbi:type IV pili twitching motility protein PilT [Streptomyces sp. NPDC090045]|uniref:type IV pili twitching motility protein PilT n=1 Tax=Streptomyces sp. NPDC090045 TaxID=3365927 RepID=UPI003821792F